MKQEIGSQIKNLQGSILFKGLVTLFLGLLILIPIGQIKSLLEERENRMYMVRDEIIEKWGGWQYLAGPILSVPVIETTQEIIDGKLDQIIKRHYLHILPDSLNIIGNVESELRKKGIYNIELYTGDFIMEGSFQTDIIPAFPFNDSEILWDKAELIIGLGDVKGLSSGVTLEWDKKNYGFNGGAGKSGIFLTGISSKVPLDKTSNYSFKISLELKGGETLSFLPLGIETNVSVTSNWPGPNFQGAFLPESHDISENGFSAEWNVHALARNFPQEWLNTEIDFNTLYSGSFGINFISPVDGYFKNHRAIKYRMMFIFIPFIALFIFEIFTKTKVHPFQYLLTGFAIAMFFLLLLSISEQLNFGIAYLISAGASTLLVAVYSGSVFKSRLRGLIMAVISIILYTYLYMSLVSEDYALIIGSIGLFLILAAVMIITRKLNWYKL